MRRVPINLHTLKTRRYLRGSRPWDIPGLSLVGLHAALRIAAPLTSTDRPACWVHPGQQGENMRDSMRLG